MAKGFLVEVSKDRSRACFFIGAIEISFGLDERGKVHEVYRCKEGAQVHDKNACRVHKSTYAVICNQAAAILRPRHNSKSEQPKKSQQMSLF